MLHELDYLPVTANCPLYLGNGQVTCAWIVTQLGVSGEMRPPYTTKLGSGLPIHLHDPALAAHNDSFEKVWLFGTLVKVEWREPGFHVYLFQPSLYTITGHPYPVR
jgi:hypothetical protein